MDHFPKERVGQQAIESPLGPGKVQGVGRGLPLIGMLQTHVAWCRMEDGLLFDPFDVHGSGQLVDGRLDITRRVKALIMVLKFIGHEGVTHSDIEIEDLGDDTDSFNYCIVADAYSPWGEGTDGPYFDTDSCIQDFKKTVIDFFEGDPSVKVEFMNLERGSNEIEFTRDI